MYKAQEINSGHKDLIHDVSFDFYGRRIATCSSDQSVKVWDLIDDKWVCTADWKTHSGSVWKVTWAHPEFGQVLATCSFDRTAVIWEEQVGDATVAKAGAISHWVQRASLVDSRTSVTDIKFAPKHYGLQAATCSKDGVVRIYEAPDVMNLCHWSLQHEIQCKLSCSCLSWNPSRIQPPLLAVGSDDASMSAGGKVQIHEYNETARNFQKLETLMFVTDAVHDVAFAPNLGRSFGLLAIAARDVHLISVKPAKTSGILTNGTTGAANGARITALAVFTEHESPVWRVEWNLTGTVLSSAGDDGCVRLWKANYLNNWKCITELQGNGTTVPGSTLNFTSAGQTEQRQGSPLNSTDVAQFRGHPMW